MSAAVELEVELETPESRAIRTGSPAVEFPATRAPTVNNNNSSKTKTPPPARPAAPENGCSSCLMTTCGCPPCRFSCCGLWTIAVGANICVWIMMVLFVWINWIVGFFWSFGYVIVLIIWFRYIRKARITEELHQAGPIKSPTHQKQLEAAALSRFDPKESLLALLIPLAIAMAGLYIPVNIILTQYIYSPSYYTYQFNNELYLKTILGQLPSDASSNLTYWATMWYNDQSQDYIVGSNPGEIIFTSDSVIMRYNGSGAEAIKYYLGGTGYVINSGGNIVMYKNIVFMIDAYSGDSYVKGVLVGTTFQSGKSGTIYFATSWDSYDYLDAGSLYHDVGTDLLWFKNGLTLYVCDGTLYGTQTSKDYFALTNATVGVEYSELEEGDVYRPSSNVYNSDANAMIAVLFISVLPAVISAFYLYRITRYGSLMFDFFFLFYFFVGTVALIIIWKAGTYANFWVFTYKFLTIWGAVCILVLLVWRLKFGLDDEHFSWGINTSSLSFFFFLHFALRLTLDGPAWKWIVYLLIVTSYLYLTILTQRFLLMVQWYCGVVAFGSWLSLVITSGITHTTTRYVIIFFVDMGFAVMSLIVAVNLQRKVKIYRTRMLSNLGFFEIPDGDVESVNGGRGAKRDDFSEDGFDMNRVPENDVKVDDEKQ